MGSNDKIRRLLTSVRRDVLEETGGRQRPWESSSLTNDVYLIQQSAAPTVAPMTRLNVPAGSVSPITLQAPEVYGSTDATVTFDLLPDVGKLLVDGTPIEAHKSYPPASLLSVTYDPGTAAEGSVTVAGYTAIGSGGQRTQGMLALTVVKPAAPALADATAPAPAQAAEQVVADASVAATIGVGPNLVSIDPGLSRQSRRASTSRSTTCPRAASSASGPEKSRAAPSSVPPSFRISNSSRRWEPRGASSRWICR